MFNDFVSLIIAPIVVGIAIELFSHWLAENDKDDD